MNCDLLQSASEHQVLVGLRADLEEMGLFLNRLRGC